MFTNTTNEKDKIIQIIPAPPGMYAAYKDLDGGEDIHAPVICLGLWNDGGVSFLNVDSDGFIHVAEESRNYIGVYKT